MPALDGVRGLAVIGVLLYHAGHLHGGFLGVDLFFVLSGFLITSLLVSEQQATGTIRLRAFWARRARRLLPALLLLLIGVAAYAAFAAASGELDAIRRDAVATLGYVANWVQISAGLSYWDAFKAPSPLEHTWSLAIEEQFYLVWPLVVIGLLRMGRGSLRWLAAGCGVLAVASIVLLQLLYQPGHDPSRVYFGSDTRAAALLYGALAAVLFRSRRRREHVHAQRWWPVVVPVAGVAIGWSWVVATGASEWLYRWGLPVTGAGSAVVIYGLAAGRGGPTQRLLAWRPLRHVGAISYGLYLWHWPVNVYLTAARAHLSGWALTATRFAVTFAIAEASYHLVEMPIRRGAWGGLRIRIATPAALSGALAVVLIATAGGVVPSLPGSPSASAAVAPAPARADDPTRVLVVGDSGAFELTPGLLQASSELGVETTLAGEIGCGLQQHGDGVHVATGFLADPAECHDWPRRWKAQVDHVRPDIALVVFAWGGIGDRDLDGRLLHPCDEAFDAYWTAQAELAIDTLQTRGAFVLFATTPYVDMDIAVDERVNCLNNVFRAAVSSRPGAAIVDLAGWLCPGEGRDSCRTEEAGATLRKDGMHFDGDGGTIAGRYLMGEVMRSRDVSPRTRPQVVLFGDSTAFVMGMSFEPKLASFELQQSTMLGCGVAPGDVLDGDRRVDMGKCAGLRDRWRATIQNTSPDLVVLMAGGWEVLDHFDGDDEVRFGEARWRELLEESLEAFVSSAPATMPVALLTAPCYRQPPELERGADRNDPERVAAWNALLRGAASRHPNVAIVDYSNYICPDGRFAESRDGVALWSDGVHLTPEGAALVWQWLIPQFEAIVGAPRSR